MRSIDVPVERTVRLVHEGEGVENTKTCISLLTFGLCMTTLPLCVQLIAFCIHLMGANATGLPKDRPRTNVSSHDLDIAQ